MMTPTSGSVIAAEFTPCTNSRWVTSGQVRVRVRSGSSSLFRFIRRTQVCFTLAVSRIASMYNSTRVAFLKLEQCTYSQRRNDPSIVNWLGLCNDAEHNISTRVKRAVIHFLKCVG